MRAACIQRALNALPNEAAPFLRRIAQATLSLSLLEIEETVMDEPALANEVRMGHLLKKVRTRLL